MGVRIGVPAAVRRTYSASMSSTTQDDEQAVGGAAGAIAGLERGEVGTQVDDVEADVRTRERHEPVGGHLALESERLLEKASRRLRVGPR